MRRIRRQPEEHMNHERWAIPYGDLLTLLLAFFVVMYSISSVNAGKYRVLSNSLYAAFRGQPRTLDPIEVGHKRVGSGADIRISIVRQDILKNQPRAYLTPLPILRPKPAANPAAAAGAPAAAVDDAMLPRVAASVDRALSQLISDRQVVVQRKPGRIEVQFRSDILFPSGSARLSGNAVIAIRKLAAVLVRFPNPVRVEGFTDNVPIRTMQFHSNWELSAARAGSVVHVLQKQGVAPRRLAVIGFGDQRPIATNATAAGRRANRRVVVLILSTKLAKHTDPAWVPGAGR
jgi:chemotaxis protein MotB